MLGRWRATTRGKLQRAVAEVVDLSARRTRELQENHHDRILAELTATTAELRQVLAELAQTRSEVGLLRERVADLEHRQRRDLRYAMDRAATDTAAAFAVANMPTAAVLGTPHDTLRFALDRVSRPGLALEFGVASGTTLRIVADVLGADHPVFGFDVFTGLPEAWRSGFPAGEFAQDTPPDVPGAELVPGLFADTLPRFLAAHPGDVAFVHLDADLYSSTTTVLDLLEDRLVPGTVLVFDEFFNYPGWQRHEYRAWTEFVARTGTAFEYLAYTADNEQVVVQLR
ncbi:TylF/MycF/NovP-related O-methyltransferase [Rhodococcus sp. DMU1]|uniref:TylF/MycF/NovP-related O-methyltransferase n=1 Tax=Rhodococcus TaxID=1827 RepID=UPI00143EBAD7|nr:class I SAM-dependent methyltransferase [Rhodococcus sp. DMU1]QIX48402.1 class I SAM-dependent methyltransferase [Rhodococcus sp. DMU1]